MRTLFLTTAVLALTALSAIGAPVVTTLADEDGSDLSGSISLREAVKHGPTNSVITFDPSLSGKTITLTLGQILITKSLTIDASNLPNGITIDADGQSRIMEIQPNTAVSLWSLTLTGGKAADFLFPGNVGGAIYANGSGMGKSVNLVLRRCTLTGNSATFGGAIYSNGSSAGIATLNLAACTLTGNSANSFGGGINSDGSSSGNATLILSACTLTGNSAVSGGGILSSGSSGQAKLSLQNTIVVGNTATLGSDLRQVGGNTASTTATGMNLVSSISDSNLGSSPPNITIVTDAKLSPLGHYGGPVQTMHPLTGSPAIDAAGTTDPGGTDARGFPRLVDGDANGSAQFDIGAVEAGPLHAVTSNAAGGANTLREKISLALSSPGARIGFQLGTLPNTITLDGSELDIPATLGLFIDASNLPNGITISANNQSRIFNIQPNSTVVLHGLILTGGTAADIAPANSGGAIHASGSGSGNSVRLTLTACTVSGNSAVRNGGGINIDGGLSGSATLSLTACTLAGNSAYYGGGINSDGRSSGSATLSLTACTLAGNSAYYGGGITCNGRASGSTTLSLTACTLTGNSAEYDGGGIHSNGSFSGSATLSLTACTLTGNSADYAGGGIYSDVISNSGQPSGKATLSLHNTLLAANTAPTGPDLGENGATATTTATGSNLMSSTAGSNLGASPAITLTADPKLAPLGDYGGPTQTMALKPGSPARDAAIPANNPPIATDSRGFPIVGVPDIGAYEAGTIDSFAIWSWETAGSPLAFYDDNENDGAPNGLEYATRRDPNMSDTPLAPALAPAVSGGRTFEFRYQKNAKDLRYIVHRSSGLTGWTEIYRYYTSTGQITRNGVTSIEDAAKGLIILTDPATGPRLFWRLVIDPVP